MSQPTIYLVRHGETEWNRDRRLQGWRDSPLTAKGREQARRVGLSLRRTVAAPEHCRILASPLRRAVHTTEIIAEACGLDSAKIQTDTRLKENGYGAWEGMTFAEIEAIDPDGLRRCRADRWQFAPPDGETFVDVERRARAWLEDLSAGAPVIVVAHGEWGRLLRGVYAGLSRPEVMALDKPQDAFFELAGGRIVRHPA